MIVEEFGYPPDEVFGSFDTDPLASASIGQAHAATRTDGTEVVVKIRRPGVVEQVHADLEILRNLAAHASRRWTAAADYDLVGLVADFAQTLQAELDYLREGHNAERFASHFTDDLDIHVPRVCWDTTSSRVLTLERVRGIKVSDLDALDKAGIDRPKLAGRATRLVADMIFEYGFFHADPHPGTCSSSRPAELASSTSAWSAKSTGRPDRASRTCSRPSRAATQIGLRPRYNRSLFPGVASIRPDCRLTRGTC